MATESFWSHSNTPTLFLTTVDDQLILRVLGIVDRERKQVRQTLTGIKTNRQGKKNGLRERTSKRTYNITEKEDKQI